MTVTSNQLNYEVKHLFNKLQKRDIEKLKKIMEYTTFDPHPIFRIVEGDIESWEISAFKSDPSSLIL
jgi:hypothetical protein